ncbi:sulfide quinone oxidoreductase [Aphomia sociella]
MCYSTMNIIRKLGIKTSLGIYRNFSVSSLNNANYSCKLLVVGGGSGGCTIAAKFARRLQKNAVIVLEPSKDHYYQPLFTLVGAGVTRVSDTCRLEESVLPTNAKWIRDAAECIDPEKGFVKTKEGHVINYEYIVIAVGLKNDYSKVPGLSEALQDRNSGVSTIFDAQYCENTWRDIQKFKGGDAIFTYPDTLIKCPGAPQKIVYLAESYFTKTNVRSKSNVMFNTCLPVIFGVKKYADALLKVVERKKINVNYKTVLKEVRHGKKEAVFFNTDDKTKETTMQYNMLHVAPPMKTPEFLNTSTSIVDQAGFLCVDKFTLQHTKYPNIYGIGDCTNTPNSKTAAAIAKQCYVLEQNLLSTMKKDNPKEKYDGYGACPLLTSYSTCILAEFVYDGVPRETLPFNQARESTIAFYMKKHLFPALYWNLMLKGYYHGPEFIRKIINPFAN